MELNYNFTVENVDKRCCECCGNLIDAHLLKKTESGYICGSCLALEEYLEDNMKNGIFECEFVEEDFPYENIETYW